MTASWPWLALLGLGMFHGVNPAMGWLFAVALGMHRSSRAVVLASLVPIAVGHALAVAAVVALVTSLGVVVDATAIRLAGGLALIGWGGYHRFYGRRHRVRVGMRTGFAGLMFWSFMMASAHGAGLMLIPLLLHVQVATGHHHDAGASSFESALAAIGVHTLGMLLATGVVAVLVYEWAGVAFLRRGWINLDLLWTWALIVTGVILLVTAVV